jgi:subtilisin
MVTRRPSKRLSAAAPDDGARQSVIVTFKRKDKRRNTRDDKLTLLVSACPRVAQLRVADLSRGAAMAASATAPDGHDINLYEAPIVTLPLTAREIQALKAHPDVAAVEDDGWAYALPTAIHTTLATSPRVMPLVFEGQPKVEDETVPVGVQAIKAVPAWGCSRGRGIKVAVLDTGVDADHPDLKPNIQGTVSFVPDESPMDGNGHGTHCAGTIGAALNGQGVVGVAPEVSMYGVKVLSNAGSGQFSWIIAGINWAITNKMQIISMSLGASQAPVALEAICNAAFNAGVLIIAAAGNDGPPKAGRPTSVGFPGRYKNVIAVSAIDASNTIASFSSRGPEVAICAPGVQVLSTQPGGGYTQLSGTSMACPHVSGAAAVIWGSHRFATNRQIWDLLGATADNLGRPGWDELYGYGRVDVSQAAMAMVPARAVALRP